ncbi:MAG: hypothetical protein K0S67_2098 [Nitrososphaeraceae archaeon]|nr:hypothetical protein [Nitrososphaeraceae archaeon]
MFIPMENIFESITWIALGFVPTLVFLEMSWRMGKITGKRKGTMAKITKTSTKTITVPAVIKA